MKKKIIIIIIALVLVVSGITCFFSPSLLACFSSAPQNIVLYGNVDNRQLNLEFLISERIARLIPEEGTFVRKDQLLGELETVRLENDIRAATAEVASRKAARDAAQARYDKAKNGSRPEDIAVARNASAAIEAKMKAAKSDYIRKNKLIKTDATSVLHQEAAEAEYFFLKSGLAAAKSYLDKLMAGDRSEDIAAAAAKLAQAKAELARSEAELAIRKQRLTDAKLYAPIDGIIRNRLLEPGELTGPHRPVLTLAQVTPKWIRVYLPETLLLKIKSGEKAKIHFDGATADFDGWVGFISPNAEFTPKNIETPELRTNLVYETRVFVNDPENKLKLGSPATVTFPGVTKK
jgi:HlyD family secretion protein